MEKVTPVFHCDQNVVVGEVDGCGGVRRTRRQALLELIGLVGVLQDKRVDEALAADLELDLLGLAVALDPGGCKRKQC